MNSFKNIAYQILKEARNPLHSKEITKIALSRGWLKTSGKTPEATMNAQLVVDINEKKEKSRFIKTAPSTFMLNEKFLAPKINQVKKTENIYKFQTMSPLNKKATSPKRGSQNLSLFSVIVLYRVTNLFQMMRELI